MAMEIDPSLKPPPSPQLAAHILPEEEQEVGYTIRDNLRSLEQHARQLGSAVCLFDFCRNRLGQGDLFFQWMFTAGRDGAMALYHFAKAMKATRDIFHRCPTWMKQVDHELLRAATKDFSSQFPSYENLRNAVAHLAELHETPEKSKINSLSVDYVGSSMNVFNSEMKYGENIDGERFTIGIAGQVVYYEMTPNSLIAINTTAAKFFKGFSAVKSAGPRGL